VLSLGRLLAMTTKGKKELTARQADRHIVFEGVIRLTTRNWTNSETMKGKLKRAGYEATKREKKGGAEKEWSKRRAFISGKD